jgi:hypothetical protein
MRVLFAATGGVGHLLPLRPLAEALRARGHEFAWAAAPDALPRLEPLGFELFRVGPTVDASRHQFREALPDAAVLEGELLSADTFPGLFDAMLDRAMLEELEQTVRRRQTDFVVHEPVALAVPLICQQYGVRHVAHGYGLRPPHEWICLDSRRACAPG